MTYKAVNFTPNEIIGGNKIRQISDNSDWLRDNTPRAMYSLPGGLMRAQGIKIASGRAIISKRNRDSAVVEVRFGNFFTTRCEPNITTGIISQGQTRIFCNISGIGRLVPDHRGFQVGVNVDATKKKKDKISKSIYVAWSAMGY